MLIECVWYNRIGDSSIPARANLTEYNGEKKSETFDFPGGIGALIVPLYFVGAGQQVLLP